MSILSIKLAIRQIARNRVSSIINILGLGIGLGCVMLMAVYLIHEFTFDRYHTNSSNIYRIIEDENCYTSYAIGEVYKAEIPEIENIFRIYMNQDTKVYIDKNTLQAEDFILADPSIFEVLDFEILLGNEENILDDKNLMAISERMSKKYFPDENPIGKTLKVNLNSNDLNFTVGGVYQDFPSNSSIQADFIGNIENVNSTSVDLEYALGFKEVKQKENYISDFNKHEFTCFIQLRKSVNKANVEGKLTEIYNRIDSEREHKGIIVLQEFSKLYLHSANYNNSESFKVNQLQSLRIFMLIGILILIVSCVNFVLISNSDNQQSIKEIACRKVNGASRKNIIAGILLKTSIIAFLSLIPALVFIKITLPLFNNLFQNDLSIRLLLKPQYLLAILSITLLTGLAAGSYMGGYISGLSPVKLFQKDLGSKGKRKHFKNSLVVIQFIVFMLLTICLIVMQKQYQYSLKKNLGFDTENILVVNFNNENFGNTASLIQNDLLSKSSISACIPTSFTTPPNANTLLISYRDDELDKPVQQEVLLMGVGEIEVLKIPLLSGVSFNSENGKDRNNIIINEAAAKKYNVSAGDNILHFRVIGVVKNFHYKSLHSPINPIFIVAQTSNHPNLLIKTEGDLLPVIKDLKEVCADISTGITFEYELLTDRVKRFYEKEEKQIGVIGFFSFIAFVLSVMGLFGFVSISISKRTKEVGIRKINGAKISEILHMLNLSIVRWVIAAFILASPVAYILMNKWLENFAYKTILSWWIFALTGLLALGVALITVSWQTWRAARKNPIESLRYE